MYKTAINKKKELQFSALVPNSSGKNIFGLLKKYKNLTTISAGIGQKASYWQEADSLNYWGGTREYGP